MKKITILQRIAGFSVLIPATVVISPLFFFNNTSVKGFLRSYSRVVAKAVRGAQRVVSSDGQGVDK
jgi:hypothetical protein